MSTSYLAEHLPAFVRAMDVAQREAAALEASLRSFNDAPPDPEMLENLDPASSLAINIEAFAARFGRLQDHLGEKLLPRLLLMLGEPPGAMLDTLNRAERLGMLENTLDWLAWRNLRNRLVHEYFQETASFAQAVAQSLQAAPKLMKLVDAIRLQAEKSGIPV